MDLFFRLLKKKSYNYHSQHYKPPSSPNPNKPPPPLNSNKPSPPSNPNKPPPNSNPNKPSPPSNPNKPSPPLNSNKPHHPNPYKPLPSNPNKPLPSNPNKPPPTSNPNKPPPHPSNSTKPTKPIKPKKKIKKYFKKNFIKYFKKKPNKKANIKPKKKPIKKPIKKINNITDFNTYPDINPIDNESNIALLIGMCYYNKKNNTQQLYGCINDVESIEKLLIQRGFLKEHIMIMTDGKEVDPLSKLFTTKENILRNFDYLLKGIVINETGEIIYKTNNQNRFFFYSAHGTRVGIKSPLKLDTQYDQMDFIIPSDFKSNNISTLISDIDFKNIINNNVSYNFKLTMLFDSCLNQSMCNLAYGYYSTLNDDKKDKVYTYQITTNDITRYTNVNTITNSQVFQMSSSEDKQYSIDIKNGNKANGVYTMGLMNFFKNPLKVCSWKELLLSHRKWSKNKRHNQIAQLSSGHEANINTDCINF